MLGSLSPDGCSIVQSRPRTAPFRQIASGRFRALALGLRSAGWKNASLKRRKQQVLLCKPRGGLNDMLSQIVSCIEYCSAFGSHLVVDGMRSGFRDDLAHYFRPCFSWVNLSFSAASLESYACGIDDCMPEAISGRVYSYEAPYSARERNHVDALSGEVLSFDKSIRHPHKLLVHEQCGSHPNSWIAFCWLRLSPIVKAEVLQRLSRLPKHYTSAHVRHSDVKTDFKSFFDSLASLATVAPLVLCTDSREVQLYAKSFFGDSRVLFPSDVTAASGLPLHDNTFTSRSTNVDLLVDLFVLANSDHLITPSPSVGYTSGFADLAKQLMVRPWLLPWLLG